jgi:hypothetical protein
VSLLNLVECTPTVHFIGCGHAAAHTERGHSRAPAGTRGYSTALAGGRRRRSTGLGTRWVLLRVPLGSLACAAAAARPRGRACGAGVRRRVRVW